MKPKVLFLSFDASRTGAPILLKDLIAWLKGIKPYMLFQYKGPLFSEFQKLGQVFLRREFSKQVGIRNRVKSAVNWRSNRRKKHAFRGADIDLIYANTILSMELIPFAKEIFKCPVILHIHELPFSINLLMGNEKFNELVPYADKIIVVSKAVKEGLLKLGVPESKITLIYEYININKIQDSIDNEYKKDSTFTVGFGGGTTWRKGYDLFLPLAIKLIKEKGYEDINFVWVGGIDKNRDKEKLDYDLERLGLQKQVRVTGSLANPYREFQKIDVFTLLSREDPFPLVCLENAYLKKPIICFNDSGGMVEFIEQGAGWTVPYLDISGLADRLEWCYKNKSEVQSKGEKAHVLSKQYSIDIIGEHIYSLINSTLENPNE